MNRDYGVTAWGRAWLSRVEPIHFSGPPDSALPRARTLCRRALSDLTIDGSTVIAHVTGTGRHPTVTLEVPTWTPKERATAAGIIGRADAEPGGDLPDRLVGELSTAGVTLAPPITDIAVSGAGVKRHHVLAVCYALIRRIDEEPVLALRLRAPTDGVARVASVPPDLIALTAIDATTFYGH